MTIGEEIMANKNVPINLFKDYYTIKYNNECKAFIKNIHIPQNYIQFIIDKLVTHELPSIRQKDKSYYLFLLWSINNLVDCINITNKQLIEIYNFMENDKHLKHEIDYKECLIKINYKMKEIT